MDAVPSQNTALRRYTLVTALATFVLVWIGGLVTSHEAGMSVPDWPNSYGYNMFFFPVSKWIGGIRFEHPHRLVASGVGLLTMILAIWLYGYKSRPLLRWGGGLVVLGGVFSLVKYPTHLGENIMTVCIGLAAAIASFIWPRCEPSPKWLRTLGVIAFIAVVVQGMLGGFRVTKMWPQLGIFHATLAQLFFLLISSIALFHTNFWRNLSHKTFSLSLPSDGEEGRGEEAHILAAIVASNLRLFFTVTTALILCQLALGATMRHQHAGLAIPDFPAAYGKIWPATDAASIEKYNQLRNDTSGFEPITAFQIILQMIHRLMALTIFIVVSFCAWFAVKNLGRQHTLAKMAFFWLGLIFVQAFLGAATIWTGRSADVATAHVACGALSLMTGGLISIVSFRLLGQSNPNIHITKISTQWGLDLGKLNKKIN